MSDIRLPPAWRRRSVYRTLNLPQRGWKVFGADLNCSDAGFSSGHDDRERLTVRDLKLDDVVLAQRERANGG